MAGRCSAKLVSLETAPVCSTSAARARGFGVTPAALDSDGEDEGNADKIEAIVSYKVRWSGTSAAGDQRIER
jgi:hypothetical protein